MRNTWIYIGLMIIAVACKNSEEQLPNINDSSLTEVTDKYPNGKVREKYHTYQDSIKHGVYTSYSDKGVIDRQGAFYNGKMVGRWVFYDSVGHIRQISYYMDSQQNGRDSLFYPNGNLESAGIYINDVEQGPWYYYYESGQLHRECIYNDGREDPVSGYTYDTNGKLLTDTIERNKIYSH